MTPSPVIPGHLVIAHEKIPSWIPRLKDLYEFEAARVSSSGSSRLDIGDVLWSRDELAGSIGLGPQETSDLNELIDFMVESRQMMRIPSFEGEPEKFISRVGETVRMLGHTYEYWMKGRPAINAARWLVEEKRVPSRTLPPSTFIDRLTAELASLPSVAGQAPNLDTAISAVVTKVSKRVAGGREPRFSEFQYQATRTFLVSQFSKSVGAHRASIITAGVGSGKTLGFALGALIAALEGALGGDRVHRTYLLIYPRRALAMDQARILGDYVEAIGAPSLVFHLEHETGYKGPEPVWKGIARVYSGVRPPNIIVTTFETLKRRIQHPLFAQAMERHLAGVVLDEIHLAEGLAGGHVALLMRRLRALAKDRELVLVGSSATVARPDEHAARIFGVPPKHVEVVSPPEDDSSAVGIAHHVFLRPSGQGSPQGALVNATSLLIHSRREDVGERGRSEKKRQKTIAFADNLDLLGRWNSDLRENERTEGGGDRKHPTSPPSETSWNERQRELPYALRFQRPLSRRLGAKGGSLGAKGEKLERFEPVLTESARQVDWCSRCQAGEKVVIADHVSKADMARLGQLVHRHPFYESDPLKIFKIRNPVFDKECDRIGTLDLCPYLQAGACLWFPRGTPGPDSSLPAQNAAPFEIEPVPEKKASIYEWRNVARSVVYSSKSSQTTPDSGDDLADVVYTAPASLVYGTRLEGKLPVDVVLASPSLEVGVDLEMLTESVMTKAMRNIASYRQKAGRVGREEGLDVINVTLVHDAPVDLHYYRQPRKLVSRGRLDPIPLKDRNDAILFSGLYNAIWDWLALRQLLPEPVPTQLKPDGLSEFADRLRQCLNALTTPGPRTELAEHLRAVARGMREVTNAELDAAVGQTIDEIGILLRDATGTLSIQPPLAKATLADVLILMDLAKTRMVRDVRPKLGSDLEPFYEHALKDLERLLPRLPVGLESDLARFHDLLEMHHTGDWDADKIHVLIEELRTHYSGGVGSPVAPTVLDLQNVVLPSLEGALRAIVPGHDPLVYSIWESYRNLLNGRDAWHRRYLFDLMRDLTGLEAVRKERWFMRPDNLFTNPFEPQVSILTAPGRERDSISVGEAVASYLPGVWTFRFPEGCYKVKSGVLNQGLGGRLVARLPDIVAEGTAVERAQTKLPPPPGLLSPIDVYRPLRLSLREERRKYVELDRLRGLVLDGDEVRSGSGPVAERSHIKIPKSYLNRWIHVRPEETKPILTLAPDEGRFFVGTPPDTVEGEDARKKIRHPLFEAHFSEASWHSPLTITEYAYSVTRSYTGGGGEGVTLTYQDRFGVDVAFGDTFQTEGFSLDLNPRGIGGVLERAVPGINQGEPVWRPSLLKAFKVIISMYTDDGNVPIVGSPFLLDDVVALLLSIPRTTADTLSLRGLVETLKVAGGAPDLGERCRTYFRRKSDPDSEEPEDYGGAVPPTDDPLIAARAKTLENTIQSLAGSVSRQADPVASARDFLPTWVRRTLLNTLGIVAVTALQEYSGATDKDVGYAVAPDSWDNGSTARVYLYDRARFGNGNADAGRRYFYVPHLLRHGLTSASRLLPTEDYLSRLEEGLLQCPQFHTDLSALEIFRNAAATSPSGIRGLTDVEGSAQEVRRVAADVWSALGISGPPDGWQLPVAAAHVEDLAASTGLARDDLIRATHICWTGCPECVDRGDLVMGEPMARNYIDKLLLDTWFMDGIARSQEYTILDLPQMSHGSSMPSFGALHEVGLDLPGGTNQTERRLRSVCLPWTIGLDVQRGASPAVARVIMRVSDILGLRLPTPSAPGVATGIGSVGFKRLMWFDLIVTAYLDALDLLGGVPKTIELVYYDCREVDFTDVGLSPRMLESVLAVARRARMSAEFDRLSDVLAWLAFRGFQIKVCVDADQASQRGMSSFLERLVALGRGNISVVQKRIQGGHMHKKVLITPIAVLKGSANLSLAGTRESEELIDHFFSGTGPYTGALTNARDTFTGAEPWRPPP